MYTKSSAMTNFKATALSWQKSSLQLVTAASVVFVVGAFGPEAQRKTYQELADELHAAVAEKGIKQSSVYRYIGLARQLVQKLGRESEGEPALKAILSAKTPETASNDLLSWIIKQHVRSLDGLAQFIGGIYARKPASEQTPQGTKRRSETVNTAEVQREAIAVASPAVVASAYVENEEHSPVDLVAALADTVSERKVIEDMIAVLTKRLNALKAAPKTARRRRQERDDANVQIVG